MCIRDRLLLETDAGQLDASLESDAFVPEFFCMKAVPVEYNTGDGSEQGGAMVLERRPACKPLYTTRLAPFAVYDCLKPARDGVIETQNGRAALYLCLCPRSGLAAGAYTAMLRMGSYCCRLDIRVYDIEIPQDTFPVTNWFSLDAISRCHGLQKDTPAFYEMVRRYARAMRRIHQTMFYIELDEDVYKRQACTCRKRGLLQSEACGAAEVTHSLAERAQCGRIKIAGPGHLRSYKGDFREFCVHEAV